MVITTLQSGLLTYFLTLLMLCALMFIHEWRELQLKVYSGPQIFKKLLHDRFLFTLKVFARNLLRGNPWRNIFFFHILFRCLTWDTNPDFSSNKPRHYTLDYTDFQTTWICIIKRSKKVSIASFVFAPNQQRLITTCLYFNKTNVSNKLREYFNNKNLKLNKI